MMFTGRLPLPMTQVSAAFTFFKRVSGLDLTLEPGPILHGKRALADRVRGRIFRVLLLGAALLVLISAQPSDATAANGSVVYTYDALGRIISSSYDTGVLITYKYDANGNRTSQVINVNSANAVWGSFSWGGALWHQ